MGHQPTVQFTPEGGVAVFLTNNSGAALTRGYLVRASGANDDSVVHTVANDEFAIGVVYQDLPNGQSGLIVIAGIADVYVDAVGPNGRNNWVGCGATIGQGTTLAASPGAVVQHFREIGHTIRSRVGAGLLRCVIHFN